MLIPILAGLLAFVLCAGVITHIYTLNWTRSGDAIAKNVTLTSGSDLNIDETVPGSGNVVINAAIDVSALVSVYIVSDGDIVLTFNDDGTPTDTITLKANKPLIWYLNCGMPCPLTADVVTFKATKATATDANLQMRCLLDPTP